MDYLHQGFKHSQDYCQALLAFAVWAAAVSLSQLWHTCDSIHPSCGQPSFCPASVQICTPPCYSRHLCFGWYVAGNNPTPDFTWWKKWLQQLKHRSQKLWRIQNNLKRDDLEVLAVKTRCKREMFAEAAPRALSSFSHWELPQSRTAE